ncbi:ABC transporter substrate-binding protein [Lysinibacillus sp. 54212]|uniref:ABC transporter substrate-binding protein n=1 Tax=Lysinibacillus sp. 54212 TaxID=3119829 RepID=UPI002FCCB811
MKNVKLLFGFMLVFVLLAACSNNKGTEKVDDTSGPKEGGSFIVGVEGDPASFNPLYTADLTSLTVQQALYSPLYYTDSGNIVPALAQSLEPSDDNLTYTLKLKEGLTWHDGQPLTAADVVFTVNAILDEKNATWTRSNYIVGDKPVVTEAKDDTTVTFTLAAVSPAFEAVIHNIYPIPKHIYENEGNLSESELNAKPVGSGPFKFVEYATSQYIKLQRFDNYFGGKPYLDELVFQVFKDDNAANLALQSGAIHMKSIKPFDLEKVKGFGSVETVIYPENRMTYLSFNMNVPELDNVKFRQALSYTLDREELITVAYGSKEFAQPASSIFTPDVLYQTTDVETYPQDLEKAKKLLEESGVDTSRSFNIIYNNSNKAFEGMALYVQQQFKKIGVNVELDGGDPSYVYPTVDDRTSTKYDLYLDGYIMRAEPDAYKLLYKGDEPYNYSNYHNDTVDALWVKAAVTPNGTEREQLYKEIQETYANDAVAYPVSYDSSILAIDKRYGGIKEAQTAPITLLRDYGKIYMK